MKILHTSDWHLGRTLYGRKRYAEFERFLDWLLETIVKEQIDVLLVAGDVFDTGTPSNTAQALYYRFLCRVASSSCRHVVIIAGNHDSPSFLNAPGELLKSLGIHVVGNLSADPRDEVLVLQNERQQPGLIVCAVPYLRDRDIRTVEPGESIADKERKLIAGIRWHYADVIELARRRRATLGGQIPIVAMGHLFTAGGQTVEGDGVRELYVGSLAHVAADIFPDDLAYLALGHLHVPQQVGGDAMRRYSGSPLPMGFGEAAQQKSVVMITVSVQDGQTGETAIALIPVPVFQRLERIQGDLAAIESRIQTLISTAAQAWLEVIYEGTDVVGDLRARLDDFIAGSELELLCVKNRRAMNRVLHRIEDQETLDDLNVHDVFQRCLNVADVPIAQQTELVAAYAEIVQSLADGDPRAD